MEKDIKDFRQMVFSCYVYNNLNKENEYLKPFRKIFGWDLFDKIFDEILEDLTSNYYISNNCFLDSENIAYKSIKKIV